LRALTLDVDDLSEIGSVRQTRISPDGRAVAYLVVSPDAETDQEQSELHVVQLSPNGGEREMLAGIHGRAPVWSPNDPEIAFLADAGARSEVRLLSLATGEIRRLALLPGKGRALTWSPAGDRLALEVEAAPAASSRIAVLDVGTGAVELIAAATGHEDSGPAWAPEGYRLAFARLEQNSARGSPRSSIQTWGADNGEPRVLPANLLFATCPSWSPDGERLACVGTAEPRLAAADPCLQPWILPAQGGAARLAAEGVNGVVLAPSPEGLPWAADGSAVYFREARAGEINLVRAEVDSQAAAVPMTRGCQTVDFTLARNGNIAFTASSPTDPGSAWVFEGDRARQLRCSLGGWTRSRGGLVPGFVRRRFQSPHGHALDGWLQGLDHDRSPQPLLVSLHGGPHGFFGPGFQAGHFYRNVLASRGWLVLSLNSSGSGSYGEAFADSIRGRWGEYDLPEHLSALEELIAAGLADPDMTAIAGYSYGGYLATWAVCHDSRFKAAVVGAPITDLTSFDRTSDIGAWYTPWEMRGRLPENSSRYERLSPLNRADAISTPLLLLHGSEDRRCPPEQSTLLAERVAAAGRSAVELVRYEGADHLFYAAGRPSQRLDFNRRIVEWLERHVNGGSADG
jgi:dipeptidyl aminopeptidase/acylaminoacyl peptidase